MAELPAADAPAGDLFDASDNGAPSARGMCRTCTAPHAAGSFAICLMKTLKLIVPGRSVTQ
jgi:hypothetical protein